MRQLTRSVGVVNERHMHRPVDFNVFDLPLHSPGVAAILGVIAQSKMIHDRDTISIKITVAGHSAVRTARIGSRLSLDDNLNSIMMIYIFNTRAFLQKTQ